MRRLAVMLLVVVFFSVSAALFAKFTPYVDVDVAMRIALIEKKDPILMFSSDSCYYCKKFKSEAFVNETVEKLLNANFVFVEVFYNKLKKTTAFGEELDYGQLFQMFGVRGTPTFWFLTEAGTPVTYLPGYVPPDTFSKVLRYMAQELYKQEVEFTKYAEGEDDYIGTPLILTVSREDAEFVLEKDPLAVRIDSLPKAVDPFKVYVTSDRSLAEKLLEKGAYRILFVEG